MLSTPLSLAQRSAAVCTATAPRTHKHSTSKHTLSSRRNPQSLSRSTLSTLHRPPPPRTHIRHSTRPLPGVYSQSPSLNASARLHSHTHTQPYYPHDLTLGCTSQHTLAGTPRARRARPCLLSHRPARSSSIAPTSAVQHKFIAFVLTGFCCGCAFAIPLRLHCYSLSTDTHPYQPSP